VDQSTELFVSEEERRLSEHLQRASDLLRSDKLHEAELEIERGMQIRRNDPRARNLRGLLLFRSARYEDARIIYLDLIAEQPEDVALRLNLGLVELRMGLYAQAAISMRQVVEREPDNKRAHGYLGLALMRAGDLHNAHAALVKAEQPELARQVEQRLAEHGDDEAKVRQELRFAAGSGARRLEADQPFALPEMEPGEPPPANEAKGHWTLHQLGEKEFLGVVPSDASRELPKSIAAFATERLVRPGEINQPCVLSGGMLVISVDGKIYTRTLGAFASTGQISFEPLYRRRRGQMSEETFGQGTDGLFVASGKGTLVIAPRGGRFSVLALEDDILFVREQGLFAFEESLHWESGRMPKSAPEIMWALQFRGIGRVVLRSARPLSTLKVEAEAPLFVESSTVFGWIGRVVPRVLPGSDDLRYVECTGEGALIVEEPSAL
jgi:uncharacterized protein (AIM24 family)